MSHAILSGAKETGVSIVEVSRDRFDAGVSLLQETYKVWKLIEPYLFKRNLQ